MTWRRNPRTITKEQFSTGTTIDGDRIDNALDDVVERVNEVPYGDLRKRWVPTTYVAGWTPQSPKCLTSGTPEPTTGVDASKVGGVYGTHHWPWLRVLNYTGEVVDDTVGAAVGDDNQITSPYRIKGAAVPGVYPFGSMDPSASFAPVSTPVGSQFAWTRSWFVEGPSILDSIDLILEVDHASYSGKLFQNDFAFAAGKAPPGYADTAAKDLVITATVDSVFAPEDRNMASVEVMRKGFAIGNDAFSELPLPKDAVTAPTYDDMAGLTTFIAGSTIQGPHIRLHRLNIPIHQDARLRVAVVIPNYAVQNRSNGWNSTAVFSGFSADYPWMQQKIHMAVTMLEEVTSG